MIAGWLTLIVAIAGALVYALSANPKMQELGRIAYFAAMIGMMVACGTVVVTLFKG